MIFGSLLLILIAVTLLVLGLADGSNGLVIGSIAASLLAAIVLVVVARRTTAARLAADGDDEATEADALGTDRVGRDRPGRDRGSRDAGPRGASRDAGSRRDDPLTDTQPGVTIPAEGPGRASGVGTLYGDPTGDDLADEQHQGAIPAQSRSGFDHTESARETVTIDDLDAELDDEDPPDEPAAAPISPADAARVARLANEVQVIDGRPRYHLMGCVHLLGRDSEPLPVSEAVELGFTPCSLCEPDSSLLAEARRV